MHEHEQLLILYNGGNGGNGGPPTEKPQKIESVAPPGIRVVGIVADTRECSLHPIGNSPLDFASAYAAHKLTNALVGKTPAEVCEQISAQHPELTLTHLSRFDMAWASNDVTVVTGFGGVLQKPTSHAQFVQEHLPQIAGRHTTISGAWASIRPFELSDWNSILTAEEIRERIRLSSYYMKVVSKSITELDIQGMYEAGLYTHENLTETAGGLKLESGSLFFTGAWSMQWDDGQRLRNYETGIIEETDPLYLRALTFGAVRPILEGLFKPQ